MNQSEKVDEIAPALVAAQRRIRNPKADAKGQVRGNPSYRYLSLPALLDVCRDVFKDVGLFWVQDPVRVDGGVGVTTRIYHLSGQWIETGPLFLPASGGPQDYGSAVTYARRYALAAFIGVAAEEDDDAARVRAPDSATRARQESGPAGPGASSRGAAPGPAPSSGRIPEVEGKQAQDNKAAAGSGEAAPSEGTEADVATGEGATASVPATPEQRSRLLAVYKKPSAVKQKAMQLFGYEKIGDVLIADLSAAEVEALLLEAAS